MPALDCLKLGAPNMVDFKDGDCYKRDPSLLGMRGSAPKDQLEDWWETLLNWAIELETNNQLMTSPITLECRVETAETPDAPGGQPEACMEPRAHHLGTAACSHTARVQKQQLPFPRDSMQATSLNHSKQLNRGMVSS